MHFVTGMLDLLELYFYPAFLPRFNIWRIISVWILILGIGWTPILTLLSLVGVKNRWQAFGLAWWEQYRTLLCAIWRNQIQIAPGAADGWRQIIAISISLSHRKLEDSAQACDDEVERDFCSQQRALLDFQSSGTWT